MLVYILDAEKRGRMVLRVIATCVSMSLKVVELLLQTAYVDL